MAIETKKVIEVEAKFSSLAQMRKVVDDAKESLNGLEVGTAEYEKQLAKVKSLQKDYNQLQSIAVKETKAAKGSYNDLVNQLARLKEAWKNTTSEVARAKLGEQINSVKSKITEMDHSIGNYQSNVGNYYNSLAPLFGKLTPMLSNIGSQVTNIGTALEGAAAAAQQSGGVISKVLAGITSTAGGAALAIGGIAVGGLIAYFKALNEQAEAFLKTTQGAAIALGSEAYMDTFRQVMYDWNEETAKAQAENRNSWKEFWSDLGSMIKTFYTSEALYSNQAAIEWGKAAGEAEKKAEAAREIAGDIYDIQRQISAQRIAEARIDAKIAELQLLAKDTTQDIAVRSQAINDIKDLTKLKYEGINEQTLTWAKRLNIVDISVDGIAKRFSGIRTLLAKLASLMRDKNELASSTAEDMDKQYAAEAAAEAAAKAQADKAKELLELEKSIATVSTRTATGNLAATEKATKAEGELRKIQEMELAAKDKLMGDQERELAQLERKYNEQKALYESHNQDITRITLVYNNERAAIEEKYAKEAATKRASAEAAAAAGRKQTMESELRSLEDYYKKQKDDNEFKARDEKERQQLDLQTTDDYLASKKAIYDKYAALEAEGTAAQLELKRRAAEAEYQAYADAKRREISESKAASQQMQRDMQSSASGIESIMNSVVSAIQNSVQARLDSGELSEQQAEDAFKVVKALQYSTTWINATAAMVAALADPTQPSFLVKSINAATALATGIAGSIQIANTQYGTAGSATSLTSAISALSTLTSAPTMDLSTPTTRVVTTEQDEVDIAKRNADQRVYVVYDDINTAGKRVEVQTSEASF